MVESWEGLDRARDRVCVCEKHRKKNERERRWYVILHGVVSPDLGILQIWGYNPVQDDRSGSGDTTRVG